VNDFHPENLLLLAKQKNQEDVDNCLAWKLSSGFSTRRFLFSLGAWMVASGEKLQVRHALPVQTGQMVFSNGKARKVGL
jgi:hypothetical protein